MAQHICSSWDCDAPNCNNVGISDAVDQEPLGWGFLTFDGTDMNLCEECIDKMRKELGDREA